MIERLCAEMSQHKKLKPNDAPYHQAMRFLRQEQSMKWRGNHGATLDHKRLCLERLRQRLPVERPWTVCKGSVVSFFSEIALLNTKCANDKSFVPLIALNVLSVLALSSHHTVDKGLTIAIEIVSFVYRYFCLEILACVAANEALRLVRSTKIGKKS